MGNCMSDSAQHHFPVLDEAGPYRRYNKKKHPRRLFHKDDASLETSFEGKIDLKEHGSAGDRDTPDKVSPKTVQGSSSSSSTSLTINTACDESFLSASVLFPSPFKKKTVKRGEDDSVGADQPRSDGTRSAQSRRYVLSTPSPAWSLTRSEKSHSKPGKALQERLQKARYMQMVMSSSTLSTSSSPTEEMEAGAHSQSKGGQQQSWSESFLSPISMLEFGTNHEKDLSNDEFEASLQQGLIWAELQVDHSPILATAFSKTQATLEYSVPSLYLAAGTEAGTLMVVEVLDGDRTSCLGNSMTLQMPSRVRTVDFLPGGDGKCLACGGDDGVCALIGVSEQDGTLFPLAEIERLDRIYAVNFSPDSQFLAVGGYDATLGIYDVTSLSTPVLVAEVDCPGLISTLSWSPDGAFLAMGGSDKLCQVVSQHSGWKKVHEIRRSAPINCLEWHPQAPQSKDDYDLAIGANDVILVDHDTFQIQQEILLGEEVVPHGGGQARVTAVCWSPSLGNFLVVCSNNSVKLLDTKSFSTLQEIRHPAGINCVVWGQQALISRQARNNHLQQFLALGGEDGKILVVKAGPTELQGIDDNASTAASSFFSTRSDWVLKDNAFSDMEDSGVPPATKSPQEVQQETGMVHTIAFSIGSKSRPSVFFATATVDGFVTVRSTTSFKVLAQLEFLDPITCIAFSNGSRLMALGSNDGTVRIVDCRNWVVSTVIEVGTPVTSLSFSKNNERLAISGNDTQLNLMNPVTDFSISGELEYESTITAVNWCSKHLAVGQEEGAISIYDTSKVFQTSDLESDDAVYVITRSASVQSLAFGPNSRFLAVGGDDGVMSVYSSLGDWALVHQVSIDFQIANLKWSPSGRHLAITGGDPGKMKSRLKVLDTVFWANIDEVQYVLESTGNGDETSWDEMSPRQSKTNTSSLAFSQDGKLLAFHSSRLGTCAVSTVSWEVVHKLQ